MRAYSNRFDVRPALIGTISTIGGTAIGPPINTLGFQDVLGIVCAGAIQGSTGATVSLAIKVQESSVPAGTGANWTDITNEAITQSSFTFDAITLGDDLAGGTTTGTWIPYEAVKKYAKLSDGNRKQYIRAHATLSGTVGLGPKFAVTFLLGKAVDSDYISSASVIASGNVEVTKLL